MRIIFKSALGALLGSSALALAAAAIAQDQPTIDAPPIGDEIVVRGVNIPDEKRATSEISAVLDETAFQRTGDSDIASALRRVTGLSISDGKFVIVRGLNERYSSVTIDGSPLPSPEPLRRVVPLDIIPTSILSGALVQKTFSPQFSAEFGGGLIELRTKPVPSEFYFNVGASVGLDLATTARQGFTHDGGSRDWLGFDDGARNLPSGLFGDPLRIQGASSADRAFQNAIDAAFESERTTLVFEEAIPVNWSGSVAGGGFFDVSDTVRFGFNAAANLSNDWQTREGRREQGLTTSAADAGARAFSGPQVEIPNAAFIGDFVSTQLTADLNGAATFGLEIGDNHEITSTNLFLRSTVKDTRVTTGIDGDDESLEIFQENLEFFERQVWQSQLRGDHYFESLNGLSVIWRGAYGEAFRDAPYQRQFRRIRDAADASFIFPFGVNEDFDNDAATVAFSDVEDENIDAGVDFVLPLKLFAQDGEIKFGYAYTDKSRTSLVREFFYEVGPIGAVPEPVQQARPDVLIRDVGPSDILDIRFTTNPISLDNAESSLLVHAGYAGVDYPLGAYFRLAAGARYEDGEQITDAVATGLPTSRSVTAINEDYILPAATLTWNPIGDLQVRAGFSQTINRPQFRELTPATFLDDETDQLIIGNPFLQNSELDNYDLRAERYFGRGQFVTIGGFYKEISNPIEVTSTQIGGQEAQTFINAPSAKLYGLEFEYERTFGLGDILGDRFESKDLILKTNYTWSQSDVSADGNVTTALISSAAGAVPVVTPGAGFIIDGRQLQGQSNHLVNFQIGYEDVDLDARATILVNWASSRIRQTRNIITGGPDVIEAPPVTLDFVWRRGFENFGGRWEVLLEMRNILGDDYRAVQTFADGTVALFDAYGLGREISASLKRKF